MALVEPVEEGLQRGRRRLARPRPPAAPQEQRWLQPGPHPPQRPRPAPPRLRPGERRRPYVLFPPARQSARPLPSGDYPAASRPGGGRGSAHQQKAKAHCTKAQWRRMARSLRTWY